MTSPVAILTVRTEGAVLRVAVAPGQSVRQALDASPLRVRAACGGTGSCGACAVRLVAGAVNPPTVADCARFSPGERASGQRLACQLKLMGDAEIWIEAPAPASPWQSIPAEDLSVVEGARRSQQHPLGVAVDLGTTRMRVALWDCRNGRRLAARHGANPQGAFGADVLNRLEAARSNPEQRRELARLARAAVLDAVRDMLARDLGEGASELSAIGPVLVVGNTAMLALLSGHGAAELLAPKNWQRRVDCRPENLSGWTAEWGLPGAELLLAPPLGGFIGSDLAADLLATQLVRTPGAALLLDFGTNTEIALWDGRALRVSSVPGGPAFEGGGRSGMPAEPGAVFRVVRANGGFDCRVIGGGEPRGICGSGLVDAIALFLDAGYLKPSGRFATSGHGSVGGRPVRGDSSIESATSDSEGFQLRPPDPRTSISGSDVDAFQRAKAATAAGAEVLLAGAGLRWSDLVRLCVCGAFGRMLDVRHAQALGLLPPVPPHRIELHGGAALAGCERALLSADPLELLASAAPEPLAVNLALVEAYGDLFIRHLRLSPSPGC
jgi:uncharacterized 2Fe-2S/4Fe-4S cluster protein (DUF4445 family)